MAEFDICYDWMMDNEDSTRACKDVPDPVLPHITPDMDNDQAATETAKARGARAVSGVNSYFHADDYYAILNLPQSERGSAVKAFYQKEFWNTWYDQTISVEVAKRVYDCAVNNGPGTAVRLVQQAAVNIGAIGLTVDGAWGPRTVDALNRCNADMLAAAFRSVRDARYVDIAARQGTDSKVLAVWRARAAK
jgi:hypothetical protein